MKQLKKTLVKFIRKHMPHLASALRFYRVEKRLDCNYEVHPDGFKFLGHKSMGQGTFEPEESKLFKKLMNHVDCCVNIGANIGYYTCMAANQGKQVYAFEPISENARILMDNVHLNNWETVEFFPLALGRQVSIAAMFGTGTGASLVEGWANIPSNDRRYIPVNTLDNVLGGRSDLLDSKILFWVDVEGFEHEVLNGGKKLLDLNQNNFWVIEICIDEHMPSGVSINPHLMEIFELFWSRGFYAYEADLKLSPVERGRVEEVVKLSKNTFSTHNFIFMKAGDQLNLS